MKTWKSLLLLTIFFTVLIPPSFAADLPTKIDRPIVRIGDTWTYIKSVGTNTSTSTYKVISLQPGGGYQAEVQRSPKGTWVEKYDSSGNVVEDNSSFFSPSQEIFRFPLEVGKLYSGSEFSKKHKKDPTRNFTLQARIKSVTQDRVIVKAGTFNVFKVEVETSYSGTSRRGYSVSNLIDETYWYSPEVGRWVKMHSNDRGNPGLEIWELESFKRGE